jgi:cobaltochelatase CobS
MSETATAVFHVNGLDKSGAVAIARHLGLRRDWARVKLAEIYAALRAFPTDKLVAAAHALVPEHFSQAEVETLCNADVEFDEDGGDDTPAAPAAETVEFREVPPPAPVPAPPSATPQSAVPAKAPDVNAVATLLAQLLATGKAGVDADDVRAIVAPMMQTQAQLVLSAVDEALTAADKNVREVVEQALKGVVPREIVVKSERAEIKLEGVQHYEFENLLHMCAARQPDGHRLNVWLYGPPGTGKTTAAKHVAKALSMSFYCNGALSTKYELIGFKDAGGTYQGTPFRQAWEHGGVYLFDEIDGSDPKAVVAFNSALANGIMAFPDGMIERHPDCVIIAASNTVHGATSEFTGRMKLDAATIDRFIFLEWAIDEKVEAAMCSNSKWLDIVQRTRRKIKDKGVKVQITPRATLYGASLLAQGLSMDFVKRVTLRKAMTNEQWELIGA